METRSLRLALIAAGVALSLAIAGGVAYRQFQAEPAPQAAPVAALPASEAADAPVVLLAQAEEPEVTAEDRVMGSADAPVTIIEYASLTCPHCAAFHTQTLPEVKSTYIDEGLVKLVFRDFPLDRVALTASLLARCVPEDRYFAMLDVLFRTQGEWSRAADPQAALTQIGRTAGLDQATIDACLSNEEATDEIVAGIQEAQEKFNVSSTPTLIINGEVHPGALSFEQVQEILKDMLPKS